MRGLSVAAIKTTAVACARRSTHNPEFTASHASASQPINVSSASSWSIIQSSSNRGRTGDRRRARSRREPSIHGQLTGLASTQPSASVISQPGISFEEFEQRHLQRQTLAKTKSDCCSRRRPWNYTSAMFADACDVTFRIGALKLTTRKFGTRKRLTMRLLTHTRWSGSVYRFPIRLP